MKFNSWSILVVFVTMCLQFSCSSDDELIGDTSLGQDYIPLKTGAWYEYQLDSIIYNDVDNSEIEKSWLLKIEVGDTITDGEGEPLIKLLRYLKPVNNNDADYQLKKVWFAKLSNGRYETFEDNLHFVKLLFPFSMGKSWQGNQFIAPTGNDNPNQSTQFYDNWDYEYVNVDIAETIQEINYENTVVVSQIDQPGGPGAINHFVAKEWYARDIGLIKKTMEIVVENCGTDNCTDKTKPVLEREKLKKGFILKQELIQYSIPD